MVWKDQTMTGSMKNRISAIEKAVSAKPDIPRTICKLKDGSITEIHGMGVLQPLLNDEIVEAVCDDANIACLLRAMDTENKVIIETYMIANGKPVRQFI